MKFSKNVLKNIIKSFGQILNKCCFFFIN